MEGEPRCWWWPSRVAVRRTRFGAVFVAATGASPTAARVSPALAWRFAAFAVMHVLVGHRGALGWRLRVDLMLLWPVYLWLLPAARGVLAADPAAMCALGTTVAVTSVTVGRCIVDSCVSGRH